MKSLQRALLRLSFLALCLAICHSFQCRIAKRGNTKLNSKLPPIDHEKPLRILLIVEPTPFGYVSGKLILQSFINAKDTNSCAATCFHTGYANRFKEMLKFLKKGGDIVSIITADPDPSPPPTFEDYPIKTLRGFEFPLYPSVTLSYDMNLNIGKAIKEFKPDIIHCSSPSCIMNPTIVWARNKNIPLLFSYHTDLPAYARAYASNIVGSEAITGFAYFMMKKYHAQADLILATSPQLKDEMERIGVRRIDVWQKGVNTDIFSPRFKSQAMRERLTQGNPKAPLLLYVGRLGTEKRITRLREVMDAIPEARLAIIGKGPAEQELKTYFEGYANVHFTGQIVGEELSAMYASCDLFVMPSDTETLGFVVIEALASGVPAVCVAAGGLVDIIDEGKTGCLADNNDDMIEFTAKVRQVIGDEEYRGQMAKNAVAWAEGISWEAATSKLRNVQYRKAIALHRARDETGRHVKDIEEALMRDF